MGKVTGKCSAVGLNNFYNGCTPERKRILDESIFGPLFNVPEKVIFVGELIDGILSFWIQENIFKIQNRELKLKELDIALILGLRLVDPRPWTVSGPVDSKESIRLKFFQEKKLVKRSDIDAIFKDENRKLSDDEFLKLSLLFVVCTFLLANSYQSLEDQYLDLVDNLANFNEFPWGQTVYNNLIESIEKAGKKRKEAAHSDGDKEYNIYGCTILLQIWAYEHMPDIAPERTERENPFPRILKWKALKYSRTPNIFQRKILQSKLRVNLKLEKFELENLMINEYLQQKRKDIEKKMEGEVKLKVEAKGKKLIAYQLEEFEEEEEEEEDTEEEKEAIYVRRSTWHMKVHGKKVMKEINEMKRAHSLFEVKVMRLVNKQGKEIEELKKENTSLRKKLRVVQNKVKKNCRAQMGIL